MSQDTVPLDLNLLDDIVPNVPVVPAGGNTRTPTVHPSKHWVFTFNNYSEENIVQMCHVFRLRSTKYYFAREVGESGTPHLQGVVSFKKKLRPLSIHLPRQIHWEKMRGTWDEAVDYCRKEGNESWVHGFTPKRPLQKLACEDNMYPWQDTLLLSLKMEPDQRSIVWIWEEIGNTGKSTFLKYLMRFHGCIPLEGKKADILHCAAEHESDLYVYDMERSLETYVSYASIEKIKNGTFMSGKYEGAVVDRNPPHVVLFANFPPETKKLSLDRWKIYKINEQLALEPWVPLEPIFNQ
ncbi:MAG: putative viral replication protein [Cressdnaviricota sp.]|nr:MAG: putative viral replication protein [Cressdnaviricota sp.]